MTDIEGEPFPGVRQDKERIRRDHNHRQLVGELRFVQQGRVKGEASNPDNSDTLWVYSRLYGQSTIRSRMWQEQDEPRIREDNEQEVSAVGRRIHRKAPGR